MRPSLVTWPQQRRRTWRSKTTLEIYAQVQKRISGKNVHAAFDRLLTGANSAVLSAQL